MTWRGFGRVLGEGLGGTLKIQLQALQGHEASNGLGERVKGALGQHFPQGQMKLASALVLEASETK